MMASDGKKAKVDAVHKSEAPAKAQKSESPAKTEAPAKTETPGKTETGAAAEPSKPAAGEAAADKPSNYSRGEGQKPVSKAYRDNWNVIFGKKSSKKRR
jgi:hypothetical protein